MVSIHASCSGENVGGVPRGSPDPVAIVAESLLRVLVGVRAGWVEGLSWSERAGCVERIGPVIVG